MTTLTERYWERVKQLPSPTPEMARYIALFGTEDYEAVQRAWEALSEDERATCQRLRAEARKQWLADDSD